MTAPGKLCFNGIIRYDEARQTYYYVAPGTKPERHIDDRMGIMPAAKHYSIWFGTQSKTHNSSIDPRSAFRHHPFHAGFARQVTEPMGLESPNSAYDIMSRTEKVLADPEILDQDKAGDLFDHFETVIDDMRFAWVDLGKRMNFSIVPRPTVAGKMTLSI